MSLEKKILKDFSKIREMQYRSYPEMRITDEETYKTIKGTSFIKILIKGLLSFFSLMYGVRPLRLITLLKNIFKKKQETVMDQFLVEKYKQLKRFFSFAN